MKDRYLYRGKELVSNKWVVGHLWQDKDLTMIITRFDTWNSTAGLLTVKATRVSPETLGQCTGERDRNGKLIFEGDKIKFNESFGIDRTLTIAWLSYTLRFVICDGSSVVMDFLGASVVMDFLGVNGLDFEVVGNIYEEEKHENK